MSDINMEIVENGVIVRVLRREKNSKGDMEYGDETMVFSSLEDAQDWLAKNAPKKRIKDGKIEDIIAED